MSQSLVAQSQGTGQLQAVSRFQSSLKKIRNSTLKGSYFLTGKRAETGTFQLELKLPEKIEWKSRAYKSKTENSFLWTQSKAFVLDEKVSPKEGAPEESNRNDPWFSLLESSLGQAALDQLIKSAIRAIDGESTIFLNLFRFELAQQESGLKTLSMTPRIPLLDAWSWTLGFQMTKSGEEKMTLWSFKNAESEYLLKFEN